MKRLLLFGVFVLLAASVIAFDWGGYLDNTTGYASVPPGGEAIDGLIQRLEGGLWLEQPVGEWTLDAKGILRWTPADSPKLLADLDRLTLSTEAIASEAGAATFGFTAGRSRYTDATGHVLGHTLDGVKMHLNMQRSSFRFGAGTTALIQKPANGIVLSRLDATDLSEPTKLFAPPRLIADFEYRMLELFAGQDLAIAATIQEDLRPEEELTAVGTETADPAAGGRVDTQYVTLKSTGPIGPGIFQTTYYTLNSGRDSSTWMTPIRAWARPTSTGRCSRIWRAPSSPGFCPRSSTRARGCSASSARVRASGDRVVRRFVPLAHDRILMFSLCNREIPRILVYRIVCDHSPRSAATCCRPSCEASSTSGAREAAAYRSRRWIRPAGGVRRIGHQPRADRRTVLRSATRPEGRAVRAQRFGDERR